MRPIVILAAFAALSFAAAPMAANAQSSGQKVEAEAKTMWEKFKGSWTQTKGAVKEQWGKLTDDDLLEIQGRRDQLVGKVQTRYGISHEEAEAQVSGWERKYKSM